MNKNNRQRIWLYCGPLSSFNVNTRDLHKRVEKINMKRFFNDLD